MNRRDFRIVAEAAVQDSRSVPSRGESALIEVKQTGVAADPGDADGERWCPVAGAELRPEHDLRRRAASLVEVVECLGSVLQRALFDP